MAHCINPNCRKEIDEQWYFCPYCGTDNRAPESRFEPAEHLHQYPGKGQYFCFWCGDKRGETYLVARRWRKPLLCAAVATVLLSSLAAAVVLYAINSSSQPRLMGFGDWCRQPIRIYERRYGYVNTVKGIKFIKWEFIGAFAVLVGIYACTRKRGYWDNDPF